MIALTKQDIAQRDQIVRMLESAKTKVEDAWPALEAAVTAFNEIIVAYNEVVATATGFGEDIAREMDEYYSGKSDKWRDSEAGEAYAEWKTEWENLNLIDADTVEMPDAFEPDHVDVLTALPTQPEEVA